MVQHWPRPSDWDPVDSSDPTPGNAEALWNLSEKFKRIAATIEQQASMLENVNNEEFWEGPSAEAFEKNRKDAVDKLKLVHTRYQTVGEALHTFHTAVVSTQGQADDALEKAKAAKAARDQAQGHLNEAKSQAATDKKWNEEHKDQPQRKIDDNPGGAYSRTVSDKNGEISHYQAVVRQAKHDFESAASSCASAIDGTLNDDLKNPHHSWFSKALHAIGGAIQSVAKAIASQPWFRTLSEWVAKAAMWVGIAALVLGWVPILGEVLDALALVLGAAALACDLIKFAADPSWSGLASLGLDVLGLATFGLGRAAGAARGLARGAEDAEKVAADAGTALKAAKAAKAGKEAELAAAAKATRQGTKGLKNPLEIRNAQSAFSRAAMRSRAEAQQAVDQAAGNFSKLSEKAAGMDHGTNGFLPNGNAVKSGTNIKGIFTGPFKAAGEVHENGFINTAKTNFHDYVGGSYNVATSNPYTEAQGMGALQAGANGVSAASAYPAGVNAGAEHQEWLNEQSAERASEGAVDYSGNVTASAP